jgi:hypothetical protein
MNHDRSCKLYPVVFLVLIGGFSIMGDDTPLPELKPEAGGGGNRIRPPTTVITGEHPDEDYNRLRRPLEEINRAFRERGMLLRQITMEKWATQHREGR